MRELIGHCAVDSGQIMLIDPCYMREVEFEPFYEECCDVTLGEKQAGSIMDKLAVVTSTGFGDGYYPVYIEYFDEGSCGMRVKSVTIDFLGNEDDVDY